MKTIKIIDLLQRCLKGDKTLPKKIKYCGEIFEKYHSTEGHYFYQNVNGDRGGILVERLNSFIELNYEVEIIEVEEDEFENIILLGVPEIDTVENERICRVEHKINSLIKNQKKIINKIKDN